MSLHPRPAAGLVRPDGRQFTGGGLTGPRPLERCVHIEVLSPGRGAPGVAECDGREMVQRTEWTGQLYAGCGGAGGVGGAGGGGHQSGLWPRWRCWRSAWR